MSRPLTTGLGLSLRGMTKSTRPPSKGAPKTPGALRTTPSTPETLRTTPGTRTPGSLPVFRGLVTSPESGELYQEERAEEITFLPGPGRVGQEGEEEYGQALTAPEQRVISVQPSRSIISSAQEKLAEFPATFTELALMPMACYSCGKIIRQRAIETALKSGRTMKQTMDELRYQRFCCRKIIMTAPSIVKLQKDLANYPHIDVETLLLEQTDIESFGMTGFIRPYQVGEPEFEPGVEPEVGPGYEPSPGRGLVIVDDAPPGTITGPGTTALCITGQGESLAPTGPVAESAYELYMAQMAEEEET